MRNPMSALLYHATHEPKDPLNILTFVSHERFEPNLCKTGHEFYSLSKFEQCDCREWKTQYAPIPQNYYIIKDGNIPQYLEFDLIIAHNQFVHLPLAQTLSKVYDAPIINVFHTMPGLGWTADHTQNMTNLLDICSHHVFISEFNQRAWFLENQHNAAIIHHGIDSDFFKPMPYTKRFGILSIANDFVNRDWALGFHLWRHIRSKVQCNVIGDTPGLSQPASNITELLSIYQKHAIYLNTSLQSPIPMSVLEAMSCGCCVVSTNTCMLPDIIQHNYNGFLFSPKQPEKFINKLEELNNNPKQVYEIGQNARKTIIEKFNISRFVHQWQELINNVVY